MPSLWSSQHNRIVLLFDLDCFYAQCERVRLGLEVDVSLALLQWNSVLAVTYPAREFGIKRGDSWDAVDTKSDGKCWGIHLKLLDLKKQQQTQTREESSTASTTTTTTTANSSNEDVVVVVDNIAEAYNAIYKLSPTEQLECRKKERGVRRFNHQGKACLERYRIASMRIFNVVLESLTERLGGADKFTLERASIDEFYLDITTYCYDGQSKRNEQQRRHQQQHNNTSTPKNESGVGEKDEDDHKTVVVGNPSPRPDEIQRALQVACRVAHLVRTDVWKELGFTMSAGVSTNKMMAKLAASYGKPNGQAMVHPESFDALMHTTKIRKVRNFGGKLGKQVLKILQKEEEEDSNVCMGELQQLSLPFLQRSGLSNETAQFVFDACRGLDCEAVKETTGALVKSITAFKSFPATSSCNEIQNWLQLLADEVVMRVQKDAARNNRYPKSCTLNYSFYTTSNGKRPPGLQSTRHLRQSKSLRLIFPHDKHPQRANDLVKQAMERLVLELKQQPLRRLGLSASNFESRGQPGVAAIDSFFKVSSKTDDETTDGKRNTKPMAGTSLRGGISASMTRQIQSPRKRVAPGLDSFFRPTQQPSHTLPVSGEAPEPPAREVNGQNAAPGPSTNPHTASATFNSQHETHGPSSCASTAFTKSSSLSDQDVALAKKLQAKEDNNFFVKPSSVAADRDLELAKRLQASFDRENYVLSRARTASKPTKKVKRIDTFFAKR